MILCSLLSEMQLYLSKCNLCKLMLSDFDVLLRNLEDNFVYIQQQSGTDLKLMADTQEETIIREAIDPQEVPKDSEHLDSGGIHQSHSQDSLLGADLKNSVLPDKQQQATDHIEEQEEIKKIPEDYFYPPDHHEKQHVDSFIPEAVTELDGFFGYDSFKRYNVQLLDRDTVIFASGISYSIYNYRTNQRQQLYSRDKGGIGTITVHPSRKYFAVGEMGTMPCIYVSEYPSLKLYRIMRKGAEKAFSHACFSHSGDMLAAVGSDPDYLLTVWDWRQERLLLKSKAFSQQIYRVSFSQFNQNWLTTSGTGHIRFWKIAETFTGLKLQGDIAKFGQFELSDVNSFSEFEDGNVLSSSQYGKLLLWEGNVIKSVVSIDPQTPCHKGSIEFVKLLDKKVVTAGSDGYIRWWDYASINFGESDEYFCLYVKPQKEVYFETANKQPACILWVEMETDFWLVQDALGRLWKYQLNDGSKEIIMEFPAGKMTDMALSPLNNCLITTGFDGYIRLWDYGNKRMFYARRFSSAAQSTCVEWLPFSKRNSGRVIVVGFADGVVRLVGLNEKEFTLIQAMKVHNGSITFIKCNREGNTLFVIDSAGSIFLIALDAFSLDKIIPYCLFNTGFKVNDASWNRTGEKILLACQDGRLHQIDVPKLKDCEFSESYLRKFSSRSYTIKMMESQKPNRQDLQLELLLKKTKGSAVADVVLDEEWEASPILNATYFDSECSKVLCSVDGNFLGFLYVIDFSKERPVSAIECSKVKTSYLRYSEQTEVIFIGLRDGSWQIRHKYNPSFEMKKRAFNQNYGIVRKVDLNVERTTLSCISQDGTMITYRFDMSSFVKGSKGDTVEKVQISVPSIILGLSDTAYSDKIDFGKNQEADIKDSSIYSLQDEKIKAEEDTKMTEAEKIKSRKLKKIKELQQEFQAVIRDNNAQADNLAKLTSEELVVDPEYAAAYQKRIQYEVEETKKQLQWDEYQATLARRKLQECYLDQLQFNSFSVKGIRTNTIVSSFKLKKLSSYVLKELSEIERLLKLNETSLGQSKDRTQSQFTQSIMNVQMNKMKETKKSKEDNQEVRNKIREAQAEFAKQLELAIATKGDYKLKSDPDYEVPENERLNVSKKKKHLFLHYQYIFLEKREFNSRLNQLRLKKNKLISQLDHINARLRVIAQEVGTEEQDIIIDFDEQVEGLEAEIEVTDQEIQEHLLQKQRQKQAAKKTTGMGSGHDGGQEKKEANLQKKPKKPKPAAKKEERAPSQARLRGTSKSKRTALQLQMAEIKLLKLQSERTKLLEDLNAEINEFDTELQRLGRVKYHLQCDLGLVQMKLLTFSEEFLIFRSMEEQDNKLTQSIISFGKEKDQLEATYVQLSSEISQIENINEALKRKYEEEKRQLKEFIYPDNDEQRERIIRYYKSRERKRLAKIKKQAELEQKARQNLEEGSDQDSQEEEEEEESESEEQEEEEEKPDITVVENDHKNFERIRKICEYDEKIEESSKRKADIEKQRHQITNKIKNITAELTKVDRELKLFQKKKLLQINQLNVSLPVRFSQIEFIVKAGDRTRLKEDLDFGILFSQQVFGCLGERIEELHRQKVDIEKRQKNLSKKLTKLKDDVSSAAKEIQEKRNQYEQKQMLKFGSTFEIERIKELQPNPQVLDMRDIYKKEQRDASKRIEAVKAALQQKKRELLEAKRQNTKVVAEITELGEKEKELNKKLDSTNKQLFKNNDASKKDELDKERGNLKDLIKFLMKEIEDLKMEIGLFKRKGGHIYTMVTSNRKNFA